MRTWILSMLLAFVAAVAVEDAMAQNFKDTEEFKECMRRYQKLPVEERGHPKLSNVDGTHKVYAVDTISVDRVKLVFEDRGLNTFAAVDTTMLFSPRNGEMVSANFVYPIISATMLWMMPIVEKLNGLCDLFYWDIEYFDDTDEVFIVPYDERPDYDGETSYYQYFDKHSRWHCGQPYLIDLIQSEPLYYMVFLITGSTYNYLLDSWWSNKDGIWYHPLKFPDLSAYYRVLVPVFQEGE